MRARAIVARLAGELAGQSGAIESQEARFSQQVGDGGDKYIGLPKLQFPKWGDPGLMPYTSGGRAA